VDVDRQGPRIDHGVPLRAAREVGLPSPAAERALDRLHAEENRDRRDAVPGHQRHPPDRAGALDGNPPGALALDWGPVAAPPLAGP
jgi:hypothetical protein